MVRTGPLTPPLNPRLKMIDGSTLFAIIRFYHHIRILCYEDLNTFTMIWFCTDCEHWSYPCQRRVSISNCPRPAAQRRLAFYPVRASTEFRCVTKNRTTLVVQWVFPSIFSNIETESNELRPNRWGFNFVFVDIKNLDYLLIWERLLIYSTPSLFLSKNANKEI